MLQRISGRRQLAACCVAAGGLLGYGSAFSLGMSTRQPARASSSTSLRMIQGKPEVFVAGATGRLGQRLVRELLQRDMLVRAAVRPASTDKAEAVFGDEGFLRQELRSGLKIMPVDMEDEASIAKAMAGCSAVASALGALETEATKFMNPYNIDGKMNQRVIKVARETGSVKHFLLISSLGTAKFGLPAGILNLFWGVLKFKRDSELALEQSGLRFTILRPGGMERPTDEYEKTHNVKLLPPDSAFGGQVSRLQVAKLAAAAIGDPELSGNKILEVVAEEDAPKLSYEELLGSTVGYIGEAEWRQKLTSKQFYILREEGTEHPFSSPLNDEKRKGVFKCAGCGQVLFKSEQKFDSGTGWPSFWAPANEQAVTSKTDIKLLIPRTENRCSKCNGHLGHVFGDGPRPTGKRYCINGAALEFEAEKPQSAL